MYVRTRVSTQGLEGETRTSTHCSDTTPGGMKSYGQGLSDRRTSRFRTPHRDLSPSTHFITVCNPLPHFEVEPCRTARPVKTIEIPVHIAPRAKILNDRRSPPTGNTAREYSTLWQGGTMFAIIKESALGHAPDMQGGTPDNIPTTDPERRETRPLHIYRSNTI